MQEKNNSNMTATESGKKLQEAVRQLVKYRVSLDPSILNEKGGVGSLQRNIRKLSRQCAKG